MNQRQSRLFDADDIGRAQERYVNAGSVGGD
jgi:hypothetical protein